uniref:Uncharacterized protein n=1 Tax=Globodera rostochiensis TaxID=31243 RepID=A0A914ID36_GLORO
MNAQKTMIVVLVIAVAMLSMEVPSVDAQCCVPDGAGGCVSSPLACCTICVPLGPDCICVDDANKTPNARNAVEAAVAAAAAANDGTATGSK